MSRFQESSHCCIFGCSDSKDNLKHYLQCESMWTWPPLLSLCRQCLWEVRSRIVLAYTVPLLFASEYLLLPTGRTMRLYSNTNNVSKMPEWKRNTVKFASYSVSSCALHGCMSRVWLMRIDIAFRRHDKYVCFVATDEFTCVGGKYVWSETNHLGKDVVLFP